MLIPWPELQRQVYKELEILTARPKKKDQEYINKYLDHEIGETEFLELRDDLSKEFSNSQIEKAQELTRQCVKKNYKDC